METAQWFGLIIGVMTAFFMAYWIFTDMGQRGARVVIWEIFGFELPVITLIVWLIECPRHG